MNFTKKTLALGLLTMGVVGTSVATVACSDDEVTPTPIVNVDAGGDSGVTKKDLYTRLGGDTGVDAALAEIIRVELTDPAIASYFTAQLATPTPAGRPTVNQLSLCFRHLIKRNTTEPKVDDYLVPAKNDGWTCRDMKTSHLGLRISSSDFDKFVMVIGSTLGGLITAGNLDVSTTEVMSLGTLLSGTKADVIDATRPGTETGFPFPTDAGTDGGDGGT